MRPYEKFGPFLLAFPLGKGGMGEVYAARTPWPARPVAAVKRLREDVAATPTYAERFAHEAELAVRLEHVNIVDTIDVGAVDGRLYIASELILGKSVGAIADHLLAQRQGAPTAIVIRVLIDVLAGLAYGHAATDRNGSWLRLVHRDVTPGNVLVGYDGVTRLTDFGLAKSAISDENLTQTGAIIGTPSYIAPELIRAGRPTPAADIYSLGAVAYRFLTGVPPFEGTKAEIMNAALTGRPRSVLEIRPDLPEWFVHFVQRMMTPDPVRRPADADALRLELESEAKTHDLAIDQSWVDLWMATYFEKDRQRSLAEAQAIASLQPLDSSHVSERTQIFARSDILSEARAPLARDPSLAKLAEEPTRILREDMLARSSREADEAGRGDGGGDGGERTYTDRPRTEVTHDPRVRDPSRSGILLPRPSNADASSGAHALPEMLESGVLIGPVPDDATADVPSVTLVPRKSAPPPPLDATPRPPASRPPLVDPSTRPSPPPDAARPSSMIESGATLEPGVTLLPLSAQPEPTQRLPKRPTVPPPAPASPLPRTRRIRAVVAGMVCLAIAAVGLGVMTLRGESAAERARRAIVLRLDLVRGRVDRKIAEKEAIDPRVVQLLAESTRAALSGDYPRAETLLGDLEVRLSAHVPTSTVGH